MKECQRLDFWKSKGADDEEAFKISAIFYARAILDQEYIRLKAILDDRGRAARIAEYDSAYAKKHLST